MDALSRVSAQVLDSALPSLPLYLLQATAVIGMIGVQKMGDNAAEVRRLRVRGTCRRRGIGALLMEKALAFCKHHGYLKIVLDVRIERGPAIALFEKFGFSHTRTREIDGRKLLDFYLDLYRDPKT